MSYLNVKNRAKSTLASAILSTDTSLTVATGEGTKFPVAPFHITIEDEILEVTAVATDTFTVTRPVEGTVVAAHASGVTVQLRVTAGIIQELQNKAVSTATLPLTITGTDIELPNVTITSANTTVGISANGSSDGAAIGYNANGSSNGAAVGANSDGYNNGTAIGYYANGSSNGAAIGYNANGYNNGTAIGYNTYGYSNGAAIGYNANGYNNGTAVGYYADGSSNGTAIGYNANGFNNGTAVGYYAGKNLNSTYLTTNKNILLGYKAGYNLTQPYAWVASTAYTAGQFVRPTTASTFNYEVTTAGTSGTTEPTWNTTLGGTTTDGTVTWTTVSMRDNNNIIIGYDIEGSANDADTLNIGDTIKGDLSIGSAGVGTIATLPTADVAHRGHFLRVEGGAGVKDVLYICEKDATDTYVWTAIT